MKPLSVPLVLVLAAASLPAVLLPSAPASAATIDSRVGALTFRPDAPGIGARRLTSASVRQDLYADRVSGTFVLDAVPTGAGTTSLLRVSFGHLDGSTCTADVEHSSPTYATTAGFTRSGRTITFRVTEGEAGYEDWDCAFAALDLEDDGDLGDGSVRSVLIGALRDVPARPDLAVTGVELLGSRNLRLVRGVWTKIDVTVTNRGRGDATRTVVRGAGKGIKVRPARYGTIADDTSSTEEVWVKLVGRRSTRLRLTVAGGGDRASRVARVRKVAPPARPAPGSYRSSDGDTTFTVTRGRARITGFRVRTRTRCGGYPDPYTYTYNTYDFPTVRIGRNGIVDARDRGELYGVNLELRISGGRVTGGYFTYAGPARCFASEHFTARRRR